MKQQGLHILRTSSANGDFVSLVKKLNAYLAAIDGKEHRFYDQYNGIALLHYVVLAYDHTIPIGCGAFKKEGGGVVEIKRMFTEEAYRNEGAATLVLKELERWAKELGYKKCILETGRKMIGAIRFYNKQGYIEIPNYGQYIDVANSICFEKIIA
ncbi:GNAT family acetyltransferase [Niabella ginsenosidivorans]|uniref:GNAT family acetyltransferase n=1 Tax=Niabella ginsenosidivorans TaxID=1176587 RepID=A0A1A9I5I6_9BACT|nr:GNAT family N-acetyltransferase [Niabella ginsenosidivorans]ANH82319.1 GNAT family acetyltransferase [Niabella ginsenosidivorans]